jgi:hypothetical protein
MIILANMKNRVIVFISVLLFLVACSAKTTVLIPAENGFDAGREFIDACLKGDFSKAAFYMLNNNKNTPLLKAIEASYREKDKDGRQELRTASIQIKKVSEPNDSTVILLYSNSVDTITKKAVVLKQNNIWLVDLQKTFQ